MESDEPCPDREATRPLRSAIVKRSVVIGGHKTSVSLEDAFWGNLKEIAQSRDMTLSDVVAEIFNQQSHGNLSSRIRLFVLEHVRAQYAASRNARSGPDDVEIAFRG